MNLILILLTFYLATVFAFSKNCIAEDKYVSDKKEIVSLEDKKVVPAPINPYNGMQEREEVYAFDQKPIILKEATNWVVVFSTKANCDTTVAIISKDGKIIRHLASGVLGKNAPFSYQQNSFKQKAE